MIIQLWREYEELSTWRMEGRIDHEGHVLAVNGLITRYPPWLVEGVAFLSLVKWASLHYLLAIWDWIFGKRGRARR